MNFSTNRRQSVWGRCGSHLQSKQSASRLHPVSRSTTPYKKLSSKQAANRTCSPCWGSSSVPQDSHGPLRCPGRTHLTTYRMRPAVVDVKRSPRFISVLVSQVWARDRVHNNRKIKFSYNNHNWNTSSSYHRNLNVHADKHWRVPTNVYNLNPCQGTETISGMNCWNGN